nr:hypothetical protein [Motiliproteus sediminis]
MGQQWAVIGGVLVVVAIIVVAHRSAEVFRVTTIEEPGWEAFSRAHAVAEFGDDGYFVRAVQHGYNLFFYTEKYAWRFTRKRAGDGHNSCASCHTVEQLAYAFVNSDREDPALQRRVSFEERVMRCYAGQMDGFVPTRYDPAVRDLRILARMVARHLNLGEGALRDET